MQVEKFKDELDVEALRHVEDVFIDEVIVRRKVNQSPHTSPPL